jgi:hypothetical protein
MSNIKLATAQTFIAHMGRDVMSICETAYELDHGIHPSILIPPEFQGWTRGQQFRWLYKCVWGGYLILRRESRNDAAALLMNRYVLWCSAHKLLSHISARSKIWILFYFFICVKKYYYFVITQKKGIIWQWFTVRVYLVQSPDRLH